MESTMLAPSLYSETMKIDWNYTIYLPKGYDLPENSSRKYPVIYLLHGAYGNHRNLVERFPIKEQIDELTAQGKLPECIVVFPDGFNSFYVNGPGFKMEDAFMKDLIPTIENKYRVSAKKEHRMIGGISMGGYGSSRFALKYPKLFNAALIISPAVWETVKPGEVCYEYHDFVDESNKFSQEIWTKEHPLSYLDSYKNANSKVSFFIMSGMKDAVVPYSEVQHFSEVLKDYTDVSLSFDDKGAHEWPFWEKAIKRALGFAGENFYNL